MNQNVGEDSPLLTGGNRVEGRSSTHDASRGLSGLSNRVKVGILLICLFSFYGYLLYATPSRVAVPSNAPTTTPTTVPTFTPSLRPTPASPTPSAGLHKTGEKKEKQPSAAPSVVSSGKDQSRTCRRTESFQESAARLVYPTFAQLNFGVRQTIELLKNKLGTYSFAYFPLATGTVAYETWSVAGMDMTSSPPAPAAGSVRTADPMEALIYYIDSIYTAVGDLSDSLTGTDQLKIVRMQELVANLTRSWNETIGRDIEPGLSWKDYLMYPGPSGRVWPGGEKVTWAIQSTSSDTSTALYLEPSNRTVDDQLWGEHRPVQGASGAAGIESLIRIQVDETVRRYQDLLNLDPSGKGDWATIPILSTQNGILTYHRVRKVLRMIGITIDGFPDVVSAFYDEIPAHVIEFVNEHYNAALKTKEPIAYGDTFSYSFGGSPITFSPSQYVCHEPVVSIGTMIFANLSSFDAIFFGISDRDLDSLRMVLMIKAFRIGEQLSLSNTTGCPSLLQSYVSITNSSKTDSDKSKLYKSAEWIQPHLAPNGYSILGTVCDIDDYFGDIHDLLVKYQQNSTVVDKTYMDYTVALAQGLQNFLSTINLPHALKIDLLKGLCKDPNF